MTREGKKRSRNKLMKISLHILTGILSTAVYIENT